MKTIGIIPARAGASRFPGKPLGSIVGMPMTGHCSHCTRLAPGLEAAYVATRLSSVMWKVSAGGR